MEKVTEQKKVLKGLSYYESEEISPSRDRFTFFISYYKLMSKLGTEQKVRLLESMCLFMFFNEEPDFTDDVLLDVAWQGIIPNLNMSMKRSENGAVGGTNSGETRRKIGNNNKAKPKQSQSNNEATTKHNGSNKNKNKEIEKEKGENKEKEIMERESGEIHSLALEDCKGFQEYISKEW